MCTMRIPGRVCRSRPVKIERDRALEALPDYVRRKCATPASARAYLASVGLRRLPNGELTVIPM